MLLPNWQWNVTSGGTLQNGILEANGPSNSYHIVELEVYIPPNAAPQRLIFETDEQSSTPHLEFKLSVHVLQIHRAALQVIDPVASSGSPWIQCEYILPDYDSVGKSRKWARHL